MISNPAMVNATTVEIAASDTESDRIVTALHQRHAPVIYLLAKKEGHVLAPGHMCAHPVNNLAVLAEVENFLGQAVGTRYQSDMTPQVAQHLEEVMVSAE